MVAARVEVAPVADEEAAAKAEWDEVARVSKATAATGTEARKARERAERDDAKLDKQGEKEVVRNTAYMHNPRLLAGSRRLTDCFLLAGCR